jgi:hypothetical protein
MIESEEIDKLDNAINTKRYMTNKEVNNKLYKFKHHNI